MDCFFDVTETVYMGLDLYVFIARTNADESGIVQGFVQRLFAIYAPRLTENGKKKNAVIKI